MLPTNMRKLFPLLLLVPTLSHAVCVLSPSNPTNGAVISYQTVLTATWSGCVKPEKIYWYIDHRLETIDTVPEAPTALIHNQTLSDYKDMVINAEAYDAVGNCIAVFSGSVNTGVTPNTCTRTDTSAVHVRQNNNGLTVSSTWITCPISAAGCGSNTAVTIGGTVSGGISPTTVLNPSGYTFASPTPDAQDVYSLDGIPVTDVSGAYASDLYANNDSSHLDLTANTWKVPFAPFPSTTRMGVICSLVAQVSCANPNDAAAPLTTASSVYAAFDTDGAGHIIMGVASSYANAAAATPTLVDITSRGSTTGSYTHFTQAAGPTWRLNDGARTNLLNIWDTRFFPDGEHIIEHQLYGVNSSVPSSTFGILTADVTCGAAGGINFHTVNVPVGLGTAVTFSVSQCGGALVGGGSPTTYYTCLFGPDNWGVATSIANAIAKTCITASGSGANATVSFTPGGIYYGPGMGVAWAVENFWLTFANGAVPMAIETASNRYIVNNTSAGSPDVFPTSPKIRNCDGSSSTVIGTDTSTSHAITSSASYSFTTQSGLAWPAGARLYIVATTSPANMMSGTISSYSGTALTVSIDKSWGSGTFTSWTISPLIYGSSDDTIFTVDNLGVIRGGTSSGGSAYFTVVDNAHLRSTMVLVTNIGSDHSVSFTHFSSTGGLNTTYSASSIFLHFPFGLPAYMIVNYPKPYAAWKAAGINAFQGGENASWGGSYANFPAWLTDWQGNSSVPNSLATQLTYLTAGAPWFHFYSVDTSVLGAYSAAGPAQSLSGLLNTVWRQQALSRMLNDLANGGYIIANEFGDESDTAVGLIWQPQGKMGFGTLGIPGHTAGGTAGLTQVVIGSGCPGTCTATFTWKQFGVNSDLTVSTNPVNCVISFSGIAGADGLCTGWSTISSSNIGTDDHLGTYWTQTTATLTAGNAGTYNSGNTPNFTIAQPYHYDVAPGTLIPQDYMDRLYGCGSNSWLTGSKPAMATNFTATGSPIMRASAYGWNCTTYVVENMAVGDWDRTGTNFHRLLALANDRDYFALADGYAPSNDWFGKPILLQTTSNYNTCNRMAGTTSLICRSDFPNSGDVYQHGGNGPQTSFLSAIMPTQFGRAGQKPYGVSSVPFDQRVPQTGIGAQNWCDFSDLCPDNYQGLANGSLFSQHERELVVSPLINCPDITGRFGLPYILAVCHKSATGKVLMLLTNTGYSDRTLTIDVSGLNQGGPAHTWALGPFADTVASASAGTNSFTATIRGGESWAYVTQPTGATDELSFYAPVVPLVGTASDAVLDVAYYVNSHNAIEALHFFCPAGVCPSVPVHQKYLDVYYRPRHLDSSKKVLRTGSWLIWQGQ